MKKLTGLKLLLLVGMICSSIVSIYGDTVTKDKLIYEINTTTNTAELKGPTSNFSIKYLIIPYQIEYNGNQYPVTSIGEDAFYEHDLTSLIIPISVTEIGDGAFYRTWLKNVTLGNSVTSIGAWAFAYTDITEIDLPNSVTFIGGRAFYNCQNLKSITIPNSTKKVSNDSFCFCYNLTEIIIGSSVESIGSDAFYGCNSLKTIKCYPQTPPDIWGDSFSNYSGHLLVPVGCLTAYRQHKYWGNFINIEEFDDYIHEDGIFLFELHRNDNTATLKGKTNVTVSDLNIPSNTTYQNVKYTVTGIKEGAFAANIDIKNLVIPNTVKSIGESAFFGCVGLKNVTIPNSITSIGVLAFSGCPIETLSVNCKEINAWFNSNSNLKKLNLGSSVSSIGDNAFSGCSGLTNIEIPNSVTKIGDNAFSGCSGLTNIDIPNSVTKIGNSAFSGCTGLKNVTIPNSVTSVGSKAFSGCPIETLSINCKEINAWFNSNSNLKKLNLGSSVSLIGDNAFSGCSGLTNIDIPNSVTKIGNSAFSGCSGLKNFTIPNSVTSVGSKAFSGCPIETLSINCKEIYAWFNSNSNLKNLNLGSSVSLIGDNAFSGCSGLINIDIPNSVTKIGNSAFSGCTNLETIIISKSVNSIGGKAFSDCNKIKSITVNATTPPTIQSNTFSDYSATLHIPVGCLDIYKKAQYWGNFIKMVCPSSVYLGVIGFNGNLKEKPIQLLNDLVVDEYTDWVNRLSLDKNTLLYYAVNTAIDKLANYNYKSKLSTAAIITFTDGLDQGSLAMDPNMLTDEQFLNYLSNRIANKKIQDINLKAYTIGVEGVDVADEQLFRNNLESLASSPENAHRINNLNQISEKFNIIYEDLSQQKDQLILTISVAVMSDKTRCRFTLDGASNPESSKIWFEGIFNRSSLQLTDIKYNGMTSSAGKTITGVANGLNVEFTLPDCRNTKGEILTINKGNIDQWTYIQSSGKWQHNVEMADTDIDLENRNTTALMLLIDCSSSLGNSDFEKLKLTANNFIERLIDIDGNYSGIEFITDDIFEDSEIDWSDATYYNLQGIRVINPSHGLFIRQLGNRSQKVLIP